MPRYGISVEAGCGLGRYVFYLSRLGIDIHGLDFHEPTVRRVQKWAKAHGFTSSFVVGDVRELPYADASLSGYVSLGVIEHFIEGPKRPLMEAYRVLRPGGMAIITTPSWSFSQGYLGLRKKFANLVKRFIGRTVSPPIFYQYWYTPRRLASLVRQAGMKVVLWGGGDLKYAFWELGVRAGGRNLAFRLADWLERTPLAQWGAQSFTVSVKVGPRMYCFFCGNPTAEESCLREFHVPLCAACSDQPIASSYRQKRLPSFEVPWKYNPAVMDAPVQRECHFCGSTFDNDPLFEDYGLRVPTCPDCLQRPEINLTLAEHYLQPVWRARRPIPKPSAGAEPTGG